MSNVEIPNLLDQFSTSIVKENVDIITFVESPKFLGRTLYPRQRTLLKIIFLQEMDDYDRKVIDQWTRGEGDVTLVPRLEERMKYLRDNGYPHFSTVQLVGGRRSSKGFVTACCIAYKLYQLTLLDDLHQHFNIPAGKEIEFAIVAASLDQAVERQFADAFDAIVDVKPLQKQRLISRTLQQSITVNTPADVRRAAALRSSGVKIDKDMASLMVRAHGTNSKTIRGAAAMLFCFDEMAHLIGGESRMSDEQLYTAAIPSLRQFREQALIFANSSPYTKTGKFFELYNNAFATDPENDPNGKIKFPDHFMLQFPSWELYRDWEDFEGTPRPQVSPPEEDEQLAREEAADPESFRVEYRAQFAEVIDSFLNPENVERMFDPRFNFDVLGRDLQPTAGAIGFMRYKGHGDPASVGANFGIAIGHLEELTTEAGIVEQHVVFDMIDAFYPADFKNKTIDWLQVVPTITELINAFRPYEFTFDQFDSTMAIQQLQENLRNMGIGDTVVHSKFATPQVNERRWKNFRAALNLGRVHAPHPNTFNPTARVNSIELARDELKFLQQKAGPNGSIRIDKQTIGPVQTKDIADCIAEVVDALIGDSINGIFNNLSNTPMAAGAQGGFAIGQTPPGNTGTFPEFSGWYGNSRYGGNPAMPERGMRRGRRW
jgi:hypothetical protein